MHARMQGYISRTQIQENQLLPAEIECMQH
jgi:hypothetical protein